MSCLVFSMFWGHTVSVQGIVLVVLSEPYGIPEIRFRMSLCKTSFLPTVLYLRPAANSLD